MSASNNNAGDQYDPLEAWQNLRNESLDAWSKMMIQAVNTDEYAKGSGALLDAYLTASIPFNEMLKKAMTQALQQANMPSRTDIVNLAQRLTQVEMRLDDLDAKLDEAAGRAAAGSGADKKQQKHKGKERGKEGE
jgi:hypothetical protein